MEKLTLRSVHLLRSEHELRPVEKAFLYEIMFSKRIGGGETS